MSMRRLHRESVEISRVDEGAIVHMAQRMGTGGITAEVRVYGSFDVAGKRYEFNRVFRVVAKEIADAEVSK